MDAFDLRNWSGFGPAGGDLAAPAIVDQISIDSRRIDSNHALFVALKGEKLDGHQYIAQAAQAGAKFALISSQWKPTENIPGLTLLSVADPLRAFQDIVKSYRLQLPTKIIGVSGSFGKTMLKDLLLILLGTQKRTAASPESFNSQIGVALSLLTLKKEHEIAIIEAAISKKQEMDVLADLIRPDYTILTPIGKKHLVTLQDLSTLSQEILKLASATAPHGWCLLPSDLPLQPVSSSPIYTWDKEQANLPHANPLHPEVTIPAYYRLSFPDQTTYQGQITTGYSYFLNLINMAAKAAWLSGISSANIQRVFQDYQPEPTRTEIWKSPHGAIFVNDTYCSDPQSVDLALRHFDFATTEHRKIFLFGGMRGEPIRAHTDYRRIGQVLAKAHIRHLFLFGQKTFKPLIEEVEKLSPETEILAFEKEQDALHYLQNHIQAHDLILIKGDKKLPLDVLTETFNDSLNNNQCVINLAAIQTNIALIRKQLAPDTRLMVIVKALAYGTDDVRMAKFLGSCGIDILGVSYVDEGVSLKRAGVTQTIFAINATNYEVAKVVKWELEVGVSSADFITALSEEAQKQNKPIHVHLHVNTGMGRFGCRPEEALSLAKLIVSSPYLRLAGLMTHFACAEDPAEDAFTYQQMSSFDQVILSLKDQGISARWTHAANSSGAIRFPQAQYNMVRIGLAVYGLYVSEAVKKALDLRLALTLTSRIVGINICKQGETISYGRRYRVERDVQKIAVLPIGYFDGLHRNYSGKAYVIIRGKKAPMIGNICMDYMMVDITDIPEAAVGDKVLIFGEDEFGQYLSPEELASSGDSIVHELITCLGPRIQRVFVYEEGRQIR
ncbi:bifunctional UDP-N-acetylmuramoyl-tripeptide:D-alanyl-D-alanine ligase/alanine racemase [Candidatus Protochlamydia phocaeensis]|uniref:bifunctional UDP-N-acetylmuramoyl-tripeptide:D-alanyl-D-alanine ligase/alanine racemase n=1 Tax=Candidatus Protochlamydia phocaeensis TaxID=1414722 RepID=UPI000837FE28|nr:bifunctional UDP-N-acetylmuramoyl-tripeptide:D-alanyl-D-alanine ligase/alanine racemase [Candidatus Protochlamydia phocaeensis]